MTEWECKDCGRSIVTTRRFDSEEDALAHMAPLIESHKKASCGGAVGRGTKQEILAESEEAMKKAAPRSKWQRRRGRKA